VWRRWDCIRLLLNSKLPRRLVLLVTNVFGISPLLVWREMTLEEAQIGDTHSLKIYNLNLIDSIISKLYLKCVIKPRGANLP
jgi:hypothetical protein